MPEIVLRPKEREALEGIVKPPDNTRQYRRAQRGCYGWPRESP